MRVVGLALILVTVSHAQWITLRTEGVPRTKDGGLDRAAPAPRTADGKADFSGLWYPGGERQACGKIPDECIEQGLGKSIEGGNDLLLRGLDIAQGMEGGLPYTPWAAELMREHDKRAGLDDPHARCLPSNPPRMFTLPHLTRIMQTPKILAMLNEFNASYRQIHVDGRKLPEDPVPSWNGYSVGHWEKDTLVIDTIGFRDDLWLDMRGDPLTNSAKMTERIRRPNFGTLEIELIVDDPKAYTKPWTVHLEARAVVDTEMIDEVCLENEKSTQHMQFAH
ncbi:MAG TPA: hypothetical protein VGN17_19105 [Bryobacteraceae bacterium]|jgi:hypothetical protein